MKLLYTDVTAQRMLLTGIVVVVTGALVVWVLWAVNRHARQLGQEVDALKGENADLKKRNAALLAGSDIPRLRAELNRALARADALLEGKIGLLGVRDQLNRRIIDLSAEVMELKGNREDQAAQIEQLQGLLTALQADRGRQL